VVVNSVWFAPAIWVARSATRPQLGRGPNSRNQTDGDKGEQHPSNRGQPRFRNLHGDHEQRPGDHHQRESREPEPNPEERSLPPERRTHHKPQTSKESARASKANDQGQFQDQDPTVDACGLTLGCRRASLELP